jgi:CubicO group peptidase (beta-lactamase class C family)
MKSKFKHLIKALFMLVALIIISCQKEKTVDLTQKENLEKVIESEYKVYRMPGLAYIAVKGDSVVYEGARGYANIHEKKAFTPQTRMLIASISKTIAVTSIMQLYEKGLISLNEDISNYLPFKVRNPNFPNDTITVKMLLTHTSSISDDGYYPSVFYLFGYVDYPQSLVDFEKDYLTQGGQYYTKNTSFSTSKPGTNYSYTNVGGALLACLVENVSGVDYNTYCITNIFLPLGMSRTTWFFNETPKDEIAIPYTDTNITDPSKPFFTYPTYPDGHLITTVEDLSRFMRAYILNGTFNNYQLLKSQTVDIILQKYIDIPDIGEQGLIFYQHLIGKDEVWGHNGGDPGVSTEMYFNRYNKTGYIMFNNRTEAYSEPIGEALLIYANK